MPDANYQKVAFELEQDEDGYPPDKWETLWAYEVDSQLFCLDNIPFFAFGVSPGDVVRVRWDDGHNVFESVARPSSSSVIRIYVFDQSTVQEARAAFRKLGCESELSGVPKMFAVEVPGSCSFEGVAALIDEGAEAGRWEYEEGCLRHPVSKE